MVEPSLLNNRPLKKVAAVVAGIFVITTSLAGCRINFKDNHVPEFAGVVVSVVDGDTFIAEVDGKEKTVDLLNVLAPAGGDDAECLGEQATENLETMLPEGKKVRLEYDDDMPPKRRNNKAAAFSSGDFVNAEVAKAGFAVAEKQSPNDPYYDRVLEAQDAAHDNGKGLFDGSNECTIASTVEPAMDRMKSVSKAPPSSVESAEDMIDDLKSILKDGQSAKDSLTGMEIEEGTAHAVVYAAEKARWEKEISGTVSAAKKRLGEVEGVHTKLVAKKKAEDKKKKELAKIAAEQRAAEEKAAAERAAAAQRAAEARAAHERAEAAQKARADAAQKAAEQRKAPEQKKKEPAKIAAKQRAAEDEAAAERAAAAQRATGARAAHERAEAAKKAKADTAQKARADEEKNKKAAEQKRAAEQKKKEQAKIVAEQRAAEEKAAAERAAAAQKAKAEAEKSKAAEKSRAAEKAKKAEEKRKAGKSHGEGD